MRLRSASSLGWIALDHFQSDGTCIRRTIVAALSHALLRYSDRLLIRQYASRVHGCQANDQSGQAVVHWAYGYLMGHQCGCHSDDRSPCAHLSLAHDQRRDVRRCLQRPGTELAATDPQNPESSWRLVENSGPRNGDCRDTGSHGDPRSPPSSEGAHTPGGAPLQP